MRRARGAWRGSVGAGGGGAPPPPPGRALTSSTVAMAQAVTLSPWHPCSFRLPPAMPSAPSPGTSWCGNSARSQKAAITGATSRSANARTRALTARSSGVRRSSRPRASCTAGGKTDMFWAKENSGVVPSARARVGARASRAAARSAAQGGGGGKCLGKAAVHVRGLEGVWRARRAGFGAHHRAGRRRNGPPAPRSCGAARRCFRQA
jgi:hypothetical protein